VLKFARSSKEYCRADVKASGDVSALPVSMAILPLGQDPVTADWKTASWVGNTARVLIGPGTDLDLDKGSYVVWVQVTATPEIPVIQSGRIQII
jgi:hypothetical protein